MKRVTLLIFAIVILIVFYGCGPQSENKNTEITKPLSEDNYYSHEILANGNLLELYADKSKTTIKRAAIIDAKSGEAAKEIELSAYHLSTRISVQTLKGGFCIMGKELLFFDINGKYIEKKEMPKNRDASTECAVSNSMSKLAYVMKEEENDEDILSLAALDLQDGSLQKLQTLNNPVPGKPSYYQSVRFAKNDQKILFSGLTNPTPDVSLDCYGWIDLASNEIQLFEGKDTEVAFSENTLWVFDECVEMGQKSSGTIRQVNTETENIREIILQDPRESQFLRRSENGDVFVTMVPDDDKQQMIFRLYKKGGLVKEKAFTFDDRASFEASSTGDAKFAYSVKANKIYYDYFVFADQEDWGTVTLASIYLGE